MTKLQNAYFSDKKNKKTADHNVLWMLLSSIMGIVLCMVCLTGITWALFSVQVQSLAGTITAAQYHLEVTVEAMVDSEGETDKETAEIEDRENGLFMLKEGGSYAVTLQAAGTASEGYGTVNIGGNFYRTAQIAKGETLSFTVVTGDTAMDLQVSSSWGRDDGCNYQMITENMEISFSDASVPSGENTTEDAGTCDASKEPETDSPNDEMSAAEQLLDNDKEIEENNQ